MIVQIMGASHVERGEKNITVVNIVRIAEALEITAEEIFKEANL